MLKKALSMMSILVLLACISAGAWAAPGDAVLFVQLENGINTNRAESLAAVGDTLYLLSQSGLYAWKSGDTEPRLVSEKIVPQHMSGPWEDLSKEDQELYKNSANVLLAGEGKLYGLNTIKGALMQFDITADGTNISEAAQLDWNDMVIKEADYTYTRQIFGAAILPGSLYLLVQQPNDNWNDYDLFSFDLASGACTKVSAPNVHAIAAYQNNELLCTIYDWDSMFTGNGERIYPALSLLDPVTSTLTKLADFPAEQVGGLAYDFESGMTYILGKGELFGLKPGGKFEPVAYMPVDYPGDQLPAAVISGGLYAAIPNYGSAYVRNTDPSFKTDKVLRIAGGYSDQVTTAFQAAYPDIPVVYVENRAYTAEDIAQNMVSGSDSADLYILSLSYGGFSSLRDKGYVSDLSKSAVLTDAVSKMYPQYVKSMFKDGKLIAFPYEFYGNTMGYSPEILKQLGIDQPPKTLSELMDLYVDWVDIYSTEFGNYSLLENIYDMRMELLNTIFISYLTHYAQTGEELKFDTPLFRSLLDKVDEVMPILEELNPSDGDQQDNSMVYSMDGDNSPTALFTSGYMFNPQEHMESGRYEPLMLSLDEGMDPTFLAQMQIFVINPNAKNSDLALVYLEYYAQNMPKGLAITLEPDNNTPVEDRYSSANIEQIKKELAVIEEQIKSAKPEEIKSLEEIKKSYEEQIAWQEDHRYSISEEMIAKYRQIVPYICVDSETLDFLTSSQEALSLLQRFIQGEMNGDQFIKEFDRKLQMMRMENN